MAIDFIALTADCRVTGQIPLADDRLSDMLNAVTRVVVRGATVEDIDTGETETGDVTISCGDLVVVVGTGRRGLENLRRKTATRRIEVELGRYVVIGDVHVPAPADPALMAGDPNDLLVGRDLLVPLTSAALRYEHAGREVDERFETLIVNRGRADRVRDASGDDGSFGEALVGASTLTVAARWGVPRHVSTGVE